MEGISSPIHFLWAKKNNDAGQFYWLPLLVHLQDTIGVMRFLWTHWMSRGQRQIIQNGLTCSDTLENREEIAINLACLLAALHDIGKCTPVFQTQCGFGSNQAEDLDMALLERLEQAGLSGIRSCNYSPDVRKRAHHTRTGAYLLITLGINLDISSIINAHHGKPVDDEDLIDKLRAYPSCLYQVEQNSPISECWKSMQKEIVDWALMETGFNKECLSQLPNISQPAQVLLSALVIMADWIASNEDYFPLLAFDEIEPIDKKSRLYNGLLKWYRSNSDESMDVTSALSAEDYYQNRFGFSPRPFQEIVFDTIVNSKEPGIYILEAPMGGGKTEAALAAVETLMAKKGLDGIFFGLPTQATSNGIFPRVEDWFENLVIEYEKCSSMKLMHGKASLNNLQQELVNRIHIDEEAGIGVQTTEWFAGRKTSMLSDAVVGTVDHFLLLALKQKHLALRHLGFSKKVVVIDEVHAYDAYMDVFLERAIEWMGAYGMPVMLLSATLPADIRKKFIQAYLRGQGIKVKNLLSKCNYMFETSAYPLLTFTDADQIHQIDNFPKIEDKGINIYQLDEKNIESLLFDKLKNGGIAGIIVNTVKRAQELYEKLYSHFDGPVIMLHAKFIDDDRINKEKDLMAMIGKGAERPYRALVIGTQVLEQSLDIDFDILISDLCPMDLLLQRLGRLHRHNIERPRGLEKASVYIVGSSPTLKILEFEEGASSIYGKYLLARTQMLLPSHEIFLPSQISPLVQAVYGQEISTVERSDSLAAYEIAKKTYYLELEQQDDKARKQYLLGKPKKEIKPERYNLIGWLATATETASEEGAVAQVRDVEESIEIIALIRCDCGYGTFAKRENIADQIDNYAVAQEIARQTIKLSALNARIAFGSLGKTIDFLEEYNCTYLSDWQDQPWLKGSLGIVFDCKEDGSAEFIMGNAILSYDRSIGLRVYQKKN